MFIEKLKEQTQLIIRITMVSTVVYAFSCILMMLGTLSYKMRFLMLPYLAIQLLINVLLFMNSILMLLILCLLFSTWHVAVTYGVIFVLIFSISSKLKSSPEVGPSGVVLKLVCIYMITHFPMEIYITFTSTNTSSTVLICPLVLSTLICMTIPLTHFWFHVKDAYSCIGKTVKPKNDPENHYPMENFG